MTPFELSLGNDLNIEWQRFANQWLFKWHGLTYEGGKVDVDDFRGGRICYGNAKFDDQKQQIFWQALERYLFSKVHEIFKRWETETTQYSATIRYNSVDGIERHLRQFVHRIMQHAQDTDQRLRGRGYPRSVEAYDPTRHMNPAQAEIGRVGHAHKKLLEAAVEREKIQKKPFLISKHLENFYANNKGLISLVGLICAAILSVATYLYTVEKDRAVFTISGIGFEPFPLTANKRTYLVLTVQNIGANYGTIEGAAIEREDKLPTEPTYDPANIAPVQIDGGKDLQVISDLGDKPLIFTQPEIAGLSNGNTHIKITGFIEYSDRYWLGGGIVGFCFVWDSTIANFTACSEKNYTYHHRYLFSPGIHVREVPMITVGTQTVSPVTMPLQMPDPRFPIQTLRTRSK